jgi:hypothetical protein
VTTEPDSPHCRIARWRPKHGGASIEVLPTRPAPDDTNFVPTLVWLLEQARKGEMVGYAILYTVETEDGNRRCIEGAKAWQDGDKHHVLGLIRRMEAGYVSRTWPDESQ